MFLSLTLTLLLQAPAKPSDQVNTVLDDWHLAAAKADVEKYFGHFTKDAIFLGTDATERWTRDEFRKYAQPYFDKGKAWTFKATKRWVSFSSDGKTAWFDEVLDTPNLGPARGSGVLVCEGQQLPGAPGASGHWKIAQYNLSVPIPNEVFKDVKKMVEEHLRKK